VGYGRFKGAAAAEALSALHEAARLYVNFFQPSFKLKSKLREGAKVTKKYEIPATPYEPSWPMIGLRTHPKINYGRSSPRWIRWRC
jgi:hypothetical protein